VPKRETIDPETHGTPALPVIQPRGLRPKRPSLWRTVSLIAVHLLMIGHVAQWLLHGVTLSPIEPSEGMELAKHGVVNTGLVFFVAAIAVTAVFGRFFCGWGCHLIALQDLSRWLLRRVGISPRPLRSRLLGLVPLVAFVYMFLWPAIYKIGTGRPLGPVTAGFLTEDFWATFPGLVVAVLTFLVCGFAIVFVLGSKGYCAYGCPYGAAFGVADRWAPVRVRVTEACRGCATCTAVCTSNVRVHEEVRDHGMVVDPGCMKCLDCVANCPNEALYVGFGTPAVGRRRTGRSPGALTWPEEVLAASVFVLAFAAFRGLYGLVPFLFSLGIAATLAGLAVVTWRVIRKRDAWLGPIRVKKNGRLRRSGVIFAAVMAVVLLVWVHSSIVQILQRRASAFYTATAPLRHSALDLAASPAPTAAEDRLLVTRATRAVGRRDRWSPVDHPGSQTERAWLALMAGENAEAKARVDRALAVDPADAGAHLLAGRLLVADGRWSEAAGAYTRVIELEPSNPSGYLGLGAIHGSTGRYGDALEVFRRGLREVPDSIDLRYNIALSQALMGDGTAAIEGFRDVLVDDSEHVAARENLAGMLAASGRFAEAVEVFEEAIRRAPEDPQLRVMAARACLGAGRRDRASEHIEAAIRIDPALAPARDLLQ
jgi:tetratricopeptide (TPR) repeat protein